MSHFALLADPANYRVTDVDLAVQTDAREYWLKLFQDHFLTVLESAKIAYGRNFGRNVVSAREKFAQIVKDLTENPSGKVASWGVIDLCRWREEALRAFGIHDPFRHVKQRENKIAKDLYPTVLRNLAKASSANRWEELVKGLFAGNIFDLGCGATIGYIKEQVDFAKVLSEVRPRPWLVDDLGELQKQLPLRGGDPMPWAKAVIFVDNAGPDFVLGVMPFVRQLAAHGTHIVLAANELPTLNDITADETVQLVQELAAMDPELETLLSAGLFEVVSTGNDLPLIDLSNVSDELNQASEGADVVILEGMGRTVESNWNTQFSVDAIQICLLKDAAIAQRVNGQVFDCVCSYRPVAKPEPAASDEKGA